jgi:amino acid adenylation domain-containing protein
MERSAPGPFQAVPTLIERVAAADPTRVAISGAGERVSYGELLDEARCLSAVIASAAPPGSTVAVDAVRHSKTVAAILAIMGSGRVFLPLDPNTPTERRHAILTASAAKCMLRAGVDRAEPSPTDGGLPELALGTDAGRRAKRVDLRPSTPAYLLFTSGSTGVPKGVLGAHGGLANLVTGLAAHYALTPTDRMLQFAALTWDTALEEMLPILSVGGTLVLRTEAALDSLPAFCDSCAAESVTVVSFPTSFWAELAASPATIPPTVRVVIVGGEAVPMDAVRRWRGHYPGVRLVNTYGLTEATAVSTLHDLTDADTKRDEHYAPIGRPLPGTSIHLLEEGGAVGPAAVAGGVVDGEIVVGGAGVALGYLGDGADRDQFVVEPTTGERFVRTGDLGHLDRDGVLWYRGRIDRQLKVRGHRIEPGEIEATIRRLPDVRETLVTTADLGRRTVLVALLAPVTGRQPDVAAVDAALRQSLPPYLMPGRLLTVSELPKMVNGKLDHAAARALATAMIGLPSEDEDAGGDEPSGVLAAVRDALGVAVGPDDQYLAIGGDSISAIRIASVLTEQGMPVTATEVMTADSFAELMALLHRRASFGSGAAQAMPAPPRSVNGADGTLRLPLTPMQRGILFEVLYGRGAQLYFDQDEFQIAGSLDVDLFRQAWQLLVRRHAALRASFHWPDGEDPYQVLHPDVTVPFAVHDCRALDEDDAASRIEELKSADLRMHFTLERPPLMRLTLVALRNGYRLVWSVHRLVLDGWSTSVALDDFMAYYDALVLGREPRLPKALDYRDYVELFEGSRGPEARQFWLGFLAGYAGPTPLPGHLPMGQRLPVSGELHQCVSTPLPATIERQLDDFVRRQRVTPSTVFRAAWGMLLSRYSGGTDVVFGVTSSGRPTHLAGAGQAIGLFINSLPLRLRVERELTVGQFLQQTQSASLAIARHELTPLADIQSWLRMRGGAPVFESLLIYQNYPGAESFSRSGAIELNHIKGFEQIHYPLSLTVRRHHGRLTAEVWYDWGLFDRGIAENILDHLCTLVDGMLARPDATLAELPPMGPRELALVVGAWSDGPTAPCDRTVLDMIGEVATARPDGVAIEASGRSMTYRELLAQVDRVAVALCRRGVGAGATLGILMPRSTSAVVAMLGIMRAGGAFVPLDAEIPPARLLRIARDARLTLALTDDLRRRLPDAEFDTVLLDELTRDRLPQPGGPPAPLPPVALHDCAYVLHTSGSTGDPKGVVVGHRALSNLTTAIVRNYRIERGVRVLHGAAISVDFSIAEIFPALAVGGCVVIRDHDTFSDIHLLTGFLRRQRIGVLILTTALWHELEAAEVAATELDTVRLIGFGGERANPGSVRRWMERFGDSIELVNGYGPTEATCETTTCFLTGPAASPDRRWTEVPIGRPILNARCYLLNSAGSPVPAGASGELYIGGLGLADGYLNDEQRTAEQFVPDRIRNDGGRLYRTNDLARFLPDGQLQFLGRMDRQVKVRGYRVEPGEVEQLILTHPAVAQALVVPVRNEQGVATGLCAYVVANDGRVPIDELQQHVAAHTTRAAVPAYWVKLDRLPLTPGGKVDEAALPPPSEAPRIGPQRNATELEARIAAVWSQVLGIEVGLEEDFFEAGGNSLLAVRLISRMRREIGLRLTVPELFQYSTVALLANRHEASGTDG